jgi:hypothetical protein
MNCCEIPGKIPSFPQTWRNELEALLCEIINERQNIDCQTVKDCETLTSFNSFTLNGGVLSISYTDEKGVITTRQQNISTAFTNPFTFNNGIGSNSGVVQLGSMPLLKNTTLDLATFIFDIDGEEVRFSDYPSTRTDSGAVNFLFTNSNGKLMSGQIDDLVGSVFSEPLEFENGLTRTGDLVELGGPLTKPTIIGSGNTQGELITNNLWIKNNTAIGEDAPLDANKFRVSSYGNFNADGGTVNVQRTFTSSNITPELDKEAYGIASTLFVYHPIIGTNTNNTVIPTRFGELGSAIRGSIFYGSNIEPDVTSAIAGVSTSAFLCSDAAAPGQPLPAPGGGDITSLIGIIARTPRQLAENAGDYTGTISDTFGLFLERQRGTEPNISTAQTRTWGIYQAGIQDVNYFAGKMRLNVASIDSYADDTAAGLGGLVAGDIYKTPTGQLMIKL